MILKKPLLCLFFSCFVFGLFEACSTSKKLDKEEWVSLFNGQDLTGWDVKIAGYEVNDNYKNTFVVQDSMIRVNYMEYDTFTTQYGHLYYHQPYSYYKLRMQYRFTGEQVPGGASWNVRNSGIMLHSQSAQSLGKDQDFPISLEMQFLGGLGSGERSTGNLCTPGTIVDINGQLAEAHCISSSSQTYHGDQWVQAEAIMLGDSLAHFLIEGDTVLTFTHARIGGGYVSNRHDFKSGKVANEAEWLKKDNSPLSTGHIALQAESHPIDFKNIELLNLEGCMNPEAINYKPYYIKSDPASCQFQ
ncbi:uncharacterized protein DUF1080 [Dyadobacter jejuensis]|uniref:Uncharacterized protein DUF1080 n=1 Tax=Dyadobacter jejuensis TaxID=1082580 RepID=A0A316AGC8_9BACT|nr:DUF1080 domain-containing protein [Dyadobacter jejuensis]PWJ56671.1 uncharacterized protein DUF1080 [Dyadobacter jejuensis]